jgi:hypothetical protein
MIRQHFELQPLYRFLPGVSDSPIEPEVLSEHIIKLLFTGIRGYNRATQERRVLAQA